MNGKYLLDTNIVIAIFAGDAGVLDRIARSNEVFLPTIACGELYYGARKSTHVAANVSRIDELAASSALIGCDINTSRHYGRIKNDLRSKGRPIPENDIWIAAVAQQNGLTLVSRDTHFDEVEALSLEVW